MPDDLPRNQIIIQDPEDISASSKRDKSMLLHKVRGRHRLGPYEDEKSEIWMRPRRIRTSTVGGEKGMRNGTRTEIYVLSQGERKSGKHV
jgi:hypothetical protein